MIGPAPSQIENLHLFGDITVLERHSLSSATYRSVPWSSSIYSTSKRQILSISSSLATAASPGLCRRSLSVRSAPISSSASLPRLTRRSGGRNALLLYSSTDRVTSTLTLMPKSRHGILIIPPSALPFSTLRIVPRILHRIYGKFMLHRSFIKKAIRNSFYRYSGIGELPMKGLRSDL